jgi:hypothetical protein
MHRIPADPLIRMVEILRNDLKRWGIGNPKHAREKVRKHLHGIGRHPGAHFSEPSGALALFCQPNFYRSPSGICPNATRRATHTGPPRDDSNFVSSRLVETIEEMQRKLAGPYSFALQSQKAAGWSCIDVLPHLCGFGNARQELAIKPDLNVDAPRVWWR